MNSLQRLDVLQMLFIPLQNDTLGSCLLARSVREACPAVPCEGCAGQRVGLGWASPHMVLKFTGHGVTNNWLINGTPCLTILQRTHGSSCFTTACPASQTWDSAGQHPGDGASPSSLLISPQLWGIPPPPPKSHSRLADRESSKGWLAPGFLALPEEGGRLSYTILQ